MKLTLKQESLLVSLAAGIFTGAALFDVLPESSKTLGIPFATIWILIGLIIWYLQKKILQRFKKPDLPPAVASALWFHSILEGIVTGLAFAVSKNLGYAVLLAMTLHLLPEFFAAITLMKNAGAKNKTSIYVTIIGFIIMYASFILTYLYLPNFGNLLPIAIALSGGAFFYIGLVSFLKIKPKGFAIWLAYILGVIITLFFN